jgi:hypothetical protein
MRGPTQTQDFKLVYIQWEDSYGCTSSWERIAGRSPSVTVCESVGWLVHEDETCKVVVPHLHRPESKDTDASGCGDMIIPASAIRKIVNLKAPRKA